MFLRRLFTALILIMVLLFGLVPLTSAGIVDGLAFSVECTGFTSQGGTLILDRNNTGSHRENFVISATDGAGSVIFAPVSDSFLVGAHVSLPAGTFFAWTSAPTANPLTLTITSSAGNNLLEEVIYKVEGSCPSLEELPAGTTLPADGVTGPSVPLNGVAPRPVNPTSVTRSQPAWLIVETDNLNIRTGDGPQYTVVAIVDGGTELVVLGRNAAATWWYVQAGDLRGWVNATLVSLRGNATGVPVVRAVGELIPPTLFLYADHPLRAAPNQSASALCTVAGNREYRIVGRNTNRSWYQVEAACDGESTVGWLPLEAGALRNPAKLTAPVTG